MNTVHSQRFRPRWLAVLAAVAVVGAGTIAAMTITVPPASAATTAGCGKTPTLHNGSYTIQSSGQSRSFILRIPDGYSNARPYRLIFGYHWRGGTMNDVASGGSSGTAWSYYGMQQQSNNSAILVAPQGIGNGWPNTNGQDIAFVRAALAWMNANYCIDQARVFSVGFSYGGIMSHTIACEMSDTFRAVAPMAGARFGRSNNCLTHPIAAWMTHGTMDTSSSGGVDFSAGESARDRVVTLNHCTTTTAAVDPSPCVAYQGCDAGYPVHWCPHPGAHTIPSFAAAAVANFFNQF